MQVFNKINQNFFLLIFLPIFKFISSQIFDNFTSGTLEEGDNELLDITDYHNMNIIVSKSKNIYMGIPPVKKVETDANLINATSLITINSNFLLTSCLNDSFLGKINLSTGKFTPLLSYSELSISPGLNIPNTICSLSNIDNTIFIGYSRITYYTDENELNKTNIIFKLNINNKDSITEGPDYDSNIGIKYFEFTESTVVTSSIRQISCEPLRVSNNVEDYRLVCLHEGIYKYHSSSTVTWENMVFATTINSDLTNFESNMTESQIKYGLKDLGFKIVRENDTYAKCMTSNAFVEIYLKKESQSSTVKIKKTYLPNHIYNLASEMDLITYNNKFRFLINKESFMGKNDIYSFKINYGYYENYFKLYDYQETLIKKIIGYFAPDKNKILCVFKTNNSIKFFHMKSMNDIFSLSDSYSKKFWLASYEKAESNLNSLITTPRLSDLGYLHIESTKNNKAGENPNNAKLVYGVDFYDTRLSNNIFIHKPSLNDWIIYYLSFIDNVENKYTRIYYLTSISIDVETCESGCSTCWDGYNECTTCDKVNYYPLSDNTDICYPKTFYVPNYINDYETKQFEKCYESCEFCSESKGTNSRNKCTSCSSGYLYSYNNGGNCYKYPGLSVTEDKMISSDNIFVATSCKKYKIASTGECVNSCPTSTPSPYIYYTYNETTKTTETKYYDIPKYLYNNACYEKCPYNLKYDSNNNCICEKAYYKENEGDSITCLSEDDCPSEYPYKNNETNECFKSLENCNYFFGDECYNNCTSGKVALSGQTEEIKNYIKEKLSLNNTMANRMCICDTSNGVWSNNNAVKNYYMECLSSCPDGYEPEEVTKQCILKSDASNQDKTTDSVNTFSDSDSVSNSNVNSESTTLSDSYTVTDSYTASDSEMEQNPTTQTSMPEPQNNDEVNCIVMFEDSCYKECPSGTCISQDSPELNTCIRKNSNTQVFNGICFDNFESLTNNIKSISDNNEVIEAPSGIIIRGYSTLSNNDNTNIDENSKYSLVDLGDCEYQLKLYYNLSNDTELYILGIDSPNKDAKASTNVYNYGVYLEDGTLLDHINVCKESKISISSRITNPELVKLSEASYFNDLGYDIFDENSNFYNDKCTPASINGNDIILSDRKKDFYPANVSLCNESCSYAKVDYKTKRFSCECNLAYNYSQNEASNENTEEEEEDVGYIDYFLSLINYKIIVCYKLFFEYKSYYYNAGFYIAVGTLILCLTLMIIFLKCGMDEMNKNILENIPTKEKLIKLLKEQYKSHSDTIIQEKRNSVVRNIPINNPPKKGDIDKKKLAKSDKNLINKQKHQTSRRKSKEKITVKKRKSRIRNKTMKIPNFDKQIYIPDSNNELNVINKENNNIIINSSINTKNNTQDEDINDINQNNGLLSDTNVDVKEFNIVPYHQAIRVDNRNYFNMFLSVMNNEIQIIRIFYYKNSYEHMSILLSEYIFELCLDLTLNCILYTEDVISEKYNNNGSIKFFTTLSLSFISNIVSSIIAFIVSKLSDYVEILESIFKNEMDKSKYFLSVLKFKKVLCFKITFFFIIQTVINLAMCYYLMIFCTIYHKTQGSIMINYITGIAESMAISLGLAIITSFLRYLSLKYKWKNIYYTSKFFFEKF